MKSKLITLIFLSLMSATNAIAQQGKATTIRKTFNRETRVSINIKSSAAKIWKLLTTAADYTKWNSTIVSLDGNIALGEKIRLVSKLDPKRTFKLKIKEFETNKKMAWGDGKGNRVYSLSDNGDGTVNFSMTEKIGGLMFPMYAKMIPPFDEQFEQFAADLKKAAER
jgi:uncharacterized protein YndB with AHSA1/START domain